MKCEERILEQKRLKDLEVQKETKLMEEKQRLKDLEIQ